MANKDIEVRKDNKDNRSVDVFDFMPEFEEMAERFFGNRFPSLLGDLPVAGRRMTSNIQETDKCYILSADIPGIPKEDVEINVSGNLLTVHAEQKKETGSVELDQGYRRQYRSFHQSFSLPTTIDPEKIEAHYENGVLEVMLPKVEKAQAKRIDIQTGKGGLLNRLIGSSNKKEGSSEEKKEMKH